MDQLTTPTSFPLALDWQGKMEPSSPSAHSQQSFAEEQQSNYDDDTYDFCNEVLFNNALIDFDVELKPEPLPLLEEAVLLLPIITKQEKDPWYDDKLKLSSASSPPFGSYAPLPAVIEDGSFTFLPEEKPKNTEELLMEFDYVYDSVELNHLTPPQTPPQSVAAVSGGVCVPIPALQNVLMQQQSQPQQFQLSYVPQLNQQQQPMHQQLSFLNPSEYYAVNEYVTAVQTPQQQQQQPQPEPPQQVPGFVGAEYGLGGTTGFSPQQMEEVMQDIVRSAAEAETLRQQEQLLGNDEEDEDDEDSCGFSETGSIDSDRCSSAVSRSPAYSDSADSSYYGSSSYGTGAPEDDEDWSPAKSKKLNLSSSAGGGSVSKKRTRPHGRGTEDKKSRKKEQNKNAATRYRQKKKAEIEEILIEESKLRERNDELKSKSADLGREVRCLKKLMRELCQAKGLI